MIWKEEGVWEGVAVHFQNTNTKTTNTKSPLIFFKDKISELQMN